MQLAGRGRTPEDRIKLLRKLAGIKEPPKVKEEKKRPSEKMKKKLVGRQAPEAAAPEPAGKAPPTAPAGGPAQAQGAPAGRVKQAEKAGPPAHKSQPSTKGTVARPKATVAKRR
jgi:hypothetical protein